MTPRHGTIQLTRVSHLKKTNNHRRLNVLPGMATEKSTKTAWDEEKQFEVTPADRFMLREDIKVGSTS